MHTVLQRLRTRRLADETERTPILPVRFPNTLSVPKIGRCENELLEERAGARPGFNENLQHVTSHTVPFFFLVHPRYSIKFVVCRI
jgi:hypothetical protein